MSTWAERFRERQARHQDRIDLFRRWRDLSIRKPEHFKIGIKRNLGFQFFIMRKSFSTVHEKSPGIVTRGSRRKDWTVLEKSRYWPR